VSSRTLHIAWDEAGCLCPVGDLFNYAAPDDASFEEEDIAEIERLTDGGYEDSNAYCLYARKNYKKGEQVCFYSLLMLLSFFFFFLLMSLFLCTYAILYRSSLVMGHTQTWNFLNTMVFF
jgi:hypothetical protein